MNIRKATMKDAQAIKGLNKKGFHHEFKLFDKTIDIDWPNKNDSYYRNAISNKNFLTLVAEVEGEIRGYLIGSVTRAESYRKYSKLVELNNMFIIKEHRGKGIGTQLIQHFLKWAKNKKMKRARVVVSFANIQGIETYKKNGFVGYDITMERNL
ncbi:MAG: GNAT family N-acetyltransferase [Nanoarchaeota archaeon]